MIPRPLLNPTHQMGQPDGWDEGGQGGKVQTLATIHVDGWHHSCWSITDEEFETIRKSRTVVLSVFGTGHPVVSLSAMLPEKVSEFIDTTQEDAIQAAKLQDEGKRVN